MRSYFYFSKNEVLELLNKFKFVEIIPTGRQYQQRYGGLFLVVDGKIELFREYYNPIVFQDAFGLKTNKLPKS